MKIPKILRVIRVHIVIGGVLAFSIGSLLAILEGNVFDAAKFLSGYIVVLLGDLSTHYSNDFFDVDVDKYNSQIKTFSGSNVLVFNPELRPLARTVSISLFALSNLFAIGLVLFLSLPIEYFLVFLGASLSGWFYSAPPLRLVSRGFGEIIIACVTGFAIPALGYLALSNGFSPLLLGLAVPFTMYGLMLALGLEAPDVEVDRKGQKRNFVVRTGIRTVFSLVLTLACASTAIFLLYDWLSSSNPIDLSLLSFFSIIPLAAACLAFIGVSKNRSVNRLSALVVASLFVFNFLLIGYFTFAVAVA